MKTKLFYYTETAVYNFNVLLCRRQHNTSGMQNPMAESDCKKKKDFHDTFGRQG